MLPSFKLSCINNHMTNSCCRGGDIDKQITLLYKWRYTIQQKQNHFEHESSLWNEYYDQCYASALHSMRCNKISPQDAIELYTYESKASVQSRKELVHSSKIKYDDIIQILQ